MSPDGKFELLELTVTMDFVLIFKSRDNLIEIRE